MARKRYIILGDGAAGTTAAETLRQLDPSAAIGIVSDDPHPAYYRAALTNYLLGELRDDQLWATLPSFYADTRVHRLHARVAAVDTRASTIRLAAGGPPQGYDGLVVATGSRPRPAAFEGASAGGVMSLRTLQDARFVMDRITIDRLARAVVIGGGPLALEWAVALRERGAAVTMLIREGRVLGSVLDATGSDLLLSRMRNLGIDVRSGEEVRAAVAGPNGRVSAIVTKSGATLPCELVGVAIGVVCNTEVLEGSGVKLGPSGGVVVDDRMATSVANVFAAGDVVEHGRRLLQLWEPARLQGRVAATNLAGGERRYEPGAFYFATRLADLDFASVGRVRSEAGVEELVDLGGRPGRIAYRKVLLSGGKLVGAIMLGHRDERVRSRGRVYKDIIDREVDVSAIARDLLDPAFDLRGWMDTKALFERPKAQPSAAQKPPTAVVRGTQMLSLAAFGKPGAPVPAAPPPSAPLEASSKQLTIGLRAPALLASMPSSGPAPAALEGPFGRVPVAPPVVCLGRDPGGQVVLDDPGVSFVHAQVVEHGGRFYLRDMGSKNGTWVGGESVTVPHPLRDGDVIQIGSTSITFRSSASAPASEAPRASAFFSAFSGDAAEVPRADLDVRSGPSAGLHLTITSSPVVIGRDPGCSLRLDDLSVSRRHAVLTDYDGHWNISDLSSSRGTLRNGVRLFPGQDVPISHGDVLVVGDSVLVFSQPPAATSPPQGGVASAPRPLR